MQDMNEIRLVPNVILFNILLNKMHYSCNYNRRKAFIGHFKSLFATRLCLKTSNCLYSIYINHLVQRCPYMLLPH